MSLHTVQVVVSTFLIGLRVSTFLVLMGLRVSTFLIGLRDWTNDDAA